MHDMRWAAAAVICVAMIGLRRRGWERRSRWNARSRRDWHQHCGAPRRAEVSVSLDAASDAVRRYQFRVTETAQFSGGDPERAPHTVKGVGDRRLGGAGANWLPRIHLLLSVRGHRVLILDVSADDLDDDALEAAAIEISLDAWERLGKG